jgi:nucleotide-binding universal stress UspA family protein
MTGADPTSVLVLPGGDLSDTSGDPRVIRVRQSLGRFQSLGGAAQLRVLRGDPVAQVLGFLAEVKGDLLVLGVRGGGPTGEMGSGHVGRDLLQTAAVAILSIPI